MSQPKWPKNQLTVSAGNLPAALQAMVKTACAKVQANSGLTFTFSTTQSGDIAFWLDPQHATCAAFEMALTTIQAPNGIISNAQVALNPDCAPCQAVIDHELVNCLGFPERYVQTPPSIFNEIIDPAAADVVPTAADAAIILATYPRVPAPPAPVKKPVQPQPVKAPVGRH